MRTLNNIILSLCVICRECKEYLDSTLPSTGLYPLLHVPLSTVAWRDIGSETCLFTGNIPLRIRTTGIISGLSFGEDVCNDARYAINLEFMRLGDWAALANIVSHVSPNGVSQSSQSERVSDHWHSQTHLWRWIAPGQVRTNTDCELKPTCSPTFFLLPLKPLPATFLSKESYFVTLICLYWRFRC